MFSDEERLAAVEFELKQISVEMQRLVDRKNELAALRDKLSDKMNLKKSKLLADKNWDRIGKLSGSTNCLTILQ